MERIKDGSNGNGWMYTVWWPGGQNGNPGIIVAREGQMEILEEIGRIAILGFALPAFLAAQPRIYYRGVVNAASFLTPGLPAGGIARGSMFSIFGSNIGPASTPALAFPLQTTLGGVSVTIAQGTTTVNAIPTFLSPSQINAIMPSNAPLGQASMRVVFNNLRSNFVPIRVVKSSFGVFTATGAGQGPGIIQNFISAAE